MLIHMSKPYLCINKIKNIHIHYIQLICILFNKHIPWTTCMSSLFAKKSAPASISESKRMLRCHECRKALRTVLKLMTSTGWYGQHGPPRGLNDTCLAHLRGAWQIFSVLNFWLKRRHRSQSEVLLYHPWRKHLATTFLTQQSIPSISSLGGLAFCVIFLFFLMDLFCWPRIFFGGCHVQPWSPFLSTSLKNTFEQNQLTYDWSPTIFLMYSSCPLPDTSDPITKKTPT